MLEYTTKYIKRVKDPVAFARKVKVALNALSKAGWAISRSDLELQGMLVVAQRESQMPLDATPGLKELLAAVASGQPGLRVMSFQDLMRGGGQGPVPGEDLSTESEKFLEVVFKNVPPGLPKAAAFKMLEKLVPDTCRKYETSKLRAIFDDMRTARAFHVANHPGCHLPELLDVVLKYGDEAVKFSIV